MTCGSAASFDNTLAFPAFHCMEYLLSYSLRSEQVRHTAWGTTRAWEILLQTWENVCGNIWIAKASYREECMSCMQNYEWFKHFKEGRTSVSEDPRPGQPSTSTDNCHVVRWFVEIIVWQSERLLRRWTFVPDWRAKREPSHLSVRTCLLMQMLMKTSWRTDLDPADFFFYSPHWKPLWKDIISGHWRGLL